MTESLIATNVGGRAFVDTAPVPAPTGPYVEHRGKYYPASKGYPIRVLADVSAERGRLVLLPHTDGVIAVLAGTNRVCFIRREEDNLDVLYSALLRLLLASSSRTPMTFGYIADIAFGSEIRNPDFRKLPAVIDPRQTWGGIAATVVFIVVCAVGGMFMRNHFGQLAIDAGHEARQTQSQVAALQGRIAVLKKNAAGAPQAPASPDKPSVSPRLQMPTPNQAFSDAILAFAPNTTLRVQHGQIQATADR